jgi:hypothetical protein
VYIEVMESATGPQQELAMVRRLETLVAFSVLNERTSIDWNQMDDQRGWRSGPCRE